MRKNVLLPLLLICVLVIAVFFAHSEGNSLKPAPALAPYAPIDGGAFLLLAAMLIYGGKVLYRKN